MANIVTFPLSVDTVPPVEIPLAPVRETAPPELMFAPARIVKIPPPAPPTAFNVTTPATPAPAVSTVLFKVIVFVFTFSPATAE